MQQALAIAKSPVLEVGCGRGELSCYLGLKGFTVSGFDLSGEGVRQGNAMAAGLNLGNRVTLAQANAQELPYPDNHFASVVGHGVLHHIAKYANTASELHRVMQPGASAVFLENLGNGPWRLVRRWTMLSKENEQFGDINLTTGFLRNWAGQFSSVHIRGINLAFMAKRLFFVRRENPDGTVVKASRTNPVSRALLSGLWLTDEVLVNHTPIGNWLGGMCLVTLKK